MSGSPEVDVTVITVTYNSARDVIDALNSTQAAAQEAGLRVQFVVVDNDSNDGSARVVRRTFPEAIVISNSVNTGFGRAANQAFKRATGRYWLLLNPDARVEKASLGALVSAIETLSAGAVAPAIGEVGAESCGMSPGIRSLAGHFLFINRLMPGDRGGPWRGFQLRRRESGRPSPVDWASAAVLLLRPTAVNAVGGFDPSFFLYGEDIDLGLRLGRAGHRTWLVPSAKAFHRIAGSQGGVSTRWLDAIHAHYRREGNPRLLSIVDLILVAGLTIRAVAATLSRSKGAVYRRRMRASAMRAWSLLLTRP